MDASYDAIVLHRAARTSLEAAPTSDASPPRANVAIQKRKLREDVTAKKIVTHPQITQTHHTELNKIINYLRFKKLFPKLIGGKKKKEKKIYK